MTFHPTEEHIPTTHPATEPADTPRTGETGGSGKVEYPTDEIHNTGKGITGTADRIRSVSQDVGDVKIDSKSFGALNEEFAVGAQQHVQTAQQHVEATAKEVDAAADATHNTATRMQNTERDNTQRFTDLDNNRTAQNTTPSGTATTTTPAGTDDGTTSTVAKPPDPPGTTDPAATPAPAAPPGGGGPPPSGPSGGGTPPAGGPPAVPGGTPSRPSWREVINDPKNFTPDERAQINDALHKMAQDPQPGKVAGAGALTPEQQLLMARVQKLVTIEPDTPMQKAMPQGSALDYLNNHTRTRAVDGWNFDPNQVGGFVARQQDATNLHSNGDIIQGNRLDYPGTRFNLADPNEPVYVMKFPAEDPSRYSTPLGAPFSKDPALLGESDPAVQATADSMTGAANTAGIPNDQYHRAVNQWPYSGIGVTADENLGLPEREMAASPIPDGAEMYSYDQSGNQTLVGRYDEALGRWIDLRPGAGATP